MPLDGKEAHTDRHKRNTAPIGTACKQDGVPAKEAQRRAWAIVNKLDGGGNKRGTGRAGAKRKPH